MAHHEIRVSEFSVASIGIILFRRGLHDAYVDFMDDLFVSGSVAVLRLGPSHAPELREAAQQFRLDYDDAYQYVIAKTHGLTLVSYDSDFERTPEGRLTPRLILDEMKRQSDESKEPDDDR